MSKTQYFHKWGASTSLDCYPLFWSEPGSVHLNGLVKSITRAEERNIYQQEASRKVHCLCPTMCRMNMEIAVSCMTLWTSSLWAFVANWTFARHWMKTCRAQILQKQIYSYLSSFIHSASEADLKCGQPVEWCKLIKRKEVTNFIIFNLHGFFFSFFPSV